LTQLVIDANVAVRAALAESGFDVLEAHELVAPPLLWIEAASGLHELRWRDEIGEGVAAGALSRLLRAPIAQRRPRQLLERAWEVADELGWAKLYDAHYVALARLLDVPLLTLDGRLRRGAARTIATLGPTEL
jgi:predicted nucleic acid-binding protein